MAAMQFWKPHSLAKPHDGQLDLRLGDKVQGGRRPARHRRGHDGQGDPGQRLQLAALPGPVHRRHRARRPRPSPHRPDRPGRQAPRQGGGEGRLNGRTLPSPNRGVAQPGRAPALGAGSRGFESRLPDHVTPGRWVSITAALDIKSPPSRRSVVMSTGSVIAVSYAPVVAGASR